MSYGATHPNVVALSGQRVRASSSYVASLVGPHTFPRASSLWWLQACQPSFEASPGYRRHMENSNATLVTRVA